MNKRLYKMYSKMFDTKWKQFLKQKSNHFNTFQINFPLKFHGKLVPFDEGLKVVSQCLAEQSYPKSWGTNILHHYDGELKTSFIRLFIDTSEGFQKKGE